MDLRKCIPLLGLWIAWSCASGYAQDLIWELGPTGTKASLRGLHAVDDQVVWVAGSQGTVLRSTDGGSSWSNGSPSEHSDLEFRSIYAWDDREACVASAGVPAVILKTLDGGKSWRRVFEHSSASAFWDALRFWDAEHGIAFSDPVDGKLLIVETADRGASWQRVAVEKLPAALPGEAGFAASNSAMCLGSHGGVWIGLGGAVGERSRILYRPAWGADWKLAACPLSSSPTQGVFSIAGDAQSKLVAVGGDYRLGISDAPKITAATSSDGGATWTAASRPPEAFRSAVVTVPRGGAWEQAWVAVGPSGSDWSLDGRQWETFSRAGFHALAGGASEVFACGADGRFAILRRH
ncbi:WD40/YVTN/BNR-like repeat-containing protein [Aureliella helgolandensis]|uniref:Ycf48-like protein n=1 Tax=Aureliella helgolandensis TaxID=2527968 RepID=A0A518G0J0_9BACT|nr:YCF48-related protein [Aureliella helgolandensis]QDV22115.1 Ycf48-like protein [Aureliella helgolandensis]